MKTVVELDADYLVYKVGFRAEKEEDGTIVPSMDINEIMEAVDYEIREIHNTIHYDEINVYIKGKDNFRDKLATLQKYKGNRDDMRKPLAHDFIYDYLKTGWRAKEAHGQEADDAVAIAAYQGRNDGSRHIIASIDKDLLTVPGYHFNPNKYLYRKIDWLTAARAFYTQMLTGDPGDHIPGLKKLTGHNASLDMKTRFRSMNTEADMYNHVLRIYTDFGLKEEFRKEWYSVSDVLLEIGRLLWIRREEGQMWNPPSAY